MYAKVIPKAIAAIKYKKCIALIVCISLFSLVGCEIAKAQELPPLMRPLSTKEQLQNFISKPFQAFFYILYVVGTFPLFIIRGFLTVWGSWGMPPFTDILAGITLFAPDVFKDSLFLLVLPVIIEAIFLFWCPPLLIVVWILTAIAVLLFAVIDFFSKISQLSTGETSTLPIREAGKGGWWD